MEQTWVAWNWKVFRLRLVGADRPTNLYLQSKSIILVQIRYNLYGTFIPPSVLLDSLLRYFPHCTDLQIPNWYCQCRILCSTLHTKGSITIPFVSDPAACSFHAEQASQHPLLLVILSMAQWDLCLRLYCSRWRYYWTHQHSLFVWTLGFQVSVSQVALKTLSHKNTNTAVLNYYFKHWWH